MSQEKFDQIDYYKKFYEVWEKTMYEAFEMWSKSPLLNKSESGGNDETIDFDPSSHYKKFYETWERTMSEALEMWLKSPLFASSAGKIMERSSELKKYLDEVMEKSLKNMHFPTKGDIDKILASLNNLEAKINDLGDKVDEINKAGRSSTKRSSTR
ncbi:MAG: hypothetical protein L0Y68_09850 [Candidatus Dadabacteria bacterium]|nr:hypothetical protein [Candidatus Dadabacteria bacterium]